MSAVSRKNHFERFDLEENFELDLDLLEEKYLAFQQLFHPDKLVHKNKEEQIDLEHNSILINESYEILKDPLKRAIYLLKLKGINIDSDSCEIKPDNATLIKNLELRELIFETSDKSTLNEIRKSCQNELKSILQKTKLEFEQKNYKKSALNLIEAKYLEKTISEIKKKITKIH